MKRRFLYPLVFFVSLALGFLITRSGFDTWDSEPHLWQSQWLISSYLGRIFPFLGEHTPDIHVQWYGPLWETILGFFSEIVFRFLHDPTWVRHSFNFTLMPICLLITYDWLLKAGRSRETALFAIAMVLSCIRLLGHTVLNTKDVPLAFTYLAVTVVLWVRFRDRERLPEDERFSLKWIIPTVVISLVPYLTRPPAMFQFLLAFGWFGFTALSAKRRWYALRQTVAFLLVALVVIYPLWPALWPFRYWEWLQSFWMLSHFPGRTEVFYLLGRVVNIRKLPFWYPYFWYTVSLNPVGLGLLLTGLGALVANLLKRKSATWENAPSVKLGKRAILIPLEIWVALCAFAPLAAFHLMHPVIYDEDRQLMFMYPVMLLLAALGLSKMLPRVKVYFAATIVLVSALAIAQWGRFTYIYRSPLVDMLGSENFIGDYWGVCVDPVVEGLLKAIPDGARIENYAPAPIFRIQTERMKHSVLFTNVHLPNFTWRNDGIPSPGEYILSYNRAGNSAVALDRMEQEVDSKKEKLVASMDMPKDGTACAATYMNGPADPNAAPSTHGPNWINSN